MVGFQWATIRQLLAGIILVPYQLPPLVLSNLRVPCVHSVRPTSAANIASSSKLDRWGHPHRPFVVLRAGEGQQIRLVCRPHGTFRVGGCPQVNL
ncbi:hypothetical protein BC830DRAFT_38040 [Chytriomyces sp. MP71]|nr:hypothetical protein BC830DRAFT_38040 [Chytriomyces sp. MP71]